jgi:DNA-binding protein HU-beta
MSRVLAIGPPSLCHIRLLSHARHHEPPGTDARRHLPERGQMTTKAELIDGVAKAAGVTKADAERTLGAFFDHVVTKTKKGEKIAWPGFGSFSTSKRAARTGRNPQTGEAVKIAASTAMKFTPSATLKAALNPKKKK